MSLKSLRTDPLRSLLGRPVAFYAVLARICSSVTAGLMLSQAVYWSDRTANNSGWFYKTQSDWTAETYLSRHEQKTARRILKERGFMREELRDLPAKVYYWVDIDRVCSALSHPAGNQHTNLRESRKQGCRVSGTGTGKQASRKPADKCAGNQQPFLIGTETSTKTTALSTAGAALKVWIEMKDELRNRLSPEEWKLWVRPAYLLKEIGSGLLVALPPNRRIVEAAQARLPTIDELAKSHGLGGVRFTRYPDQYERERIKQEYPEFYGQMYGNSEAR